jgi:hypothetical protein
MGCYSYNIQNASRRILEAKIKLRDLGKCTRCHKRKNLTIHHLKPREIGGLDEERNLITLCYGCHNYVEEHDPVWTEIKTKKSKFEKNYKKGIWHREDGMLIFTHDNDCECGDC